MDAIARARRLCRWTFLAYPVTMWVLLSLVTMGDVSGGRARWLFLPLALAAAAGFTWVFSRLVTAVIEFRYAARPVVAAGALALCAAGLGGGDPFGWGIILPIWLSVAAVGVSRRRAVALSAATFAVAVAVNAVNIWAGRSLMARDMGEPGAALVMGAMLYATLCASLPLSNRLWVWIYQLAVQAHDGREAHTRLAVAEERLRFARDLHDLVGHQLSAIAVKTELAVRLSDADVRAARAEMAEVNTLTRHALRELRQAVRGYRELDLSAELASVKSVLVAAGVRCELRLPHRDLPEGVGPVFAYAVREAVTNVLKHSSATFCDITIRFTSEEAELEVRNDGVVRRQLADLGSGLSGMRERMAAVGGELTAHPVGEGQFALNAVVSLPIPG
ncbi:sensor histidine kinase [Nonomuraea lactucae]|uniref:sensor histidine kinase n=1 Tax=Nonomuraea lactucae TaxID=2249762 RepID=UPI000DE52D30|nr:histidine kinase [Nonomuraea lactucae]